MILVLEDTQSRVDWLLERAEPVVHCFSVERLIYRVRALDGRADLILLDHDLGGDPVGLSGSTTDINGKTGLDACREMPVVDCPIIVWSHNPVGAKRMVDCLRERGMYAKHAAFGTQLCEALIREALA